MGWGRWLILGDFGQQMDLADQRTEIERLRAEIRARPGGSPTADARLEALRRENEELKLYLAAVLRLLVAKGVATRAEVESWVRAVDCDDGTEDGRAAGPLLPGK
jgi:hypothetical protein